MPEGYKHTLESRQKMTASKLGKKYALGVKHTAEARKNMSLAHIGQQSYWKGKKLPDAVREKLSKAQTGKVREMSKHWKGGKVKNKSGYSFILLREHPRAHNGYVREHRLVMEEEVGRYLEPHEIIHHINGIKDDNRIENLSLMNRADHAKCHALEASAR